MYCIACQNFCSDWGFVLVQVVKESQVDEIRLVTGSAESAALRLRVPLQQVQAQQSPLLIVSTWILMAVTLQTLRWASSPGQIVHEIQNHCRFKTSVTTFRSKIIWSFPFILGLLSKSWNAIPVTQNSCVKLYPVNTGIQQHPHKKHSPQSFGHVQVCLSHVVVCALCSQQALWCLHLKGTRSQGAVNLKCIYNLSGIASTLTKSWGQRMAVPWNRLLRGVWSLLHWRQVKTHLV